MDEWSKSIWIFVELIVASLVLLSGVLLARMAGDIGRVQQREIDAVAITKEYRLYNRYDDEDVHSQDIISLIFETRGEPQIWVDTTVGVGDSFDHIWSTSDPPTDIKWDLTHISSLLPATAAYRSTLVRNQNGEIEKIEFRR